MFNLKPSQYSHEMPGIRWQGEKLQASQFGNSEFMAACEAIGRFSRDSLTKIWTAYTDNKILMTGNRRSGEPNWHHPAGVALIGVLELDNKDLDSVITDLMHDVGEDSLIFQGHRNLVGEFESFTPVDMLAARYGECVAKAIMCLTKPNPPKPKQEMTPDAYERYLLWVYNRVLNLYPEVRVLATSTKVRDRIFNLRTESNPERLARNILESIRYILPIAKYAGDKYLAALEREINERIDVLTPAQKAQAASPAIFNVEKA